jgi:triphosphoribosyl-dephospho-CoA synthase
VESGFKTVLDFGLPVIKEYLKEDKCFNDVLVQVLLNLMTKTEDSNVLGRHDMEVLYYVKHCAERALKLGGAFTKEGMQFIRMLDKEFIKDNISPGGSADLLAITIMFYYLETDLKNESI